MSQQQEIDISGLDKAKLLYLLYFNAKSFAMTANIPAGFAEIFDGRTLEKEAIKRGYIDYFNGRPIKTDLSNDTVNPYLYDRDAGQGMFAKVVFEMRKLPTM